MTLHRLLVSALIPLILFSASALAATNAAFEGTLEFLGEAVLASGLEFRETEVGGLSGLYYDRASDRFLALSDDPSATDPARLYTLRIDLSDGKLAAGDVSIEGVTVLSDRDGEPFESFTIDGEGIAPAPGDGLFISSEGNVDRGARPFIREIDRSGVWRRDLEIPRRYVPRRGGRAGVRHNLVFESLTTTSDGRWLVAGIENALAQDGPKADLDTPSPARILRYDAASGRLRAEYLYWVDPVPLEPTSKDGFRVNGLVELLALDDQHLLALERCYAAGAGNSIRLFFVDLSGADPIGRRPLARRARRVEPARKTLLVDLADLGVSLDNLEGLSFGPELPDGRRTLVLVSDNNFDSRQRTQILAFAWSGDIPALAEIQGADHRSPLTGQWVFGTRGVVTAVDGHPERGGFWMQDPAGDGDSATSEGLFVRAPRFAVAPGAEAVVSGHVVEQARGSDLSVTRLDATYVGLLAGTRALPSPVPLGPGIPHGIDDDGLTRFEPAADAIDYFESLEGMRVEISEPVVVGPTSRFGDFVVVAARGRSLERRTRNGGLLLSDEDPRPERLQVDTRLVPKGPARAASSASDAAGLSVGTTFDGPITGVLDYSFGFFEVVATEPLPATSPPARGGDSTLLRGSATALTIATYNVENLDARDPAWKFSRVAHTIVDAMGSPDIIALQEIQDDTGADDDAVVSAGDTLERLADEIEQAGGPRYAFHQIDPLDGADGGQPGANIRVAYLVDPTRVRVPRRGAGTATTPTVVERAATGPRLVPNPGRVAPEDPAFEADETRGFAASRKPLVLEVEFADQTLFLVNAHLKSKRGDDGLFGSVQPPVRGSEAQRRRQAGAIHRFVAQVLLADPRASVVVLGDLNEHEFRAPLADLEGNLLVNLMVRAEPAERYTYVYRGVSQVLDHILVSRALADRAAPEIDVVHVNADSPAGERASDHDPIVVRLEIAAAASD